MDNREERARELVRPIIGIENRTAQEAFDIMADRIRHTFTQPATDSNAGAVGDELREALIGGPMDEEARATLGRFGWLDALITDLKDNPVAMAAIHAEDASSTGEALQEVDALIRDVRAVLASHPIAPAVADRFAGTQGVITDEIDAELEGRSTEGLEVSPAVADVAGLVERLTAYRADWHARMGDVSVLDDAIAALKACAVNRQLISKLRAALVMTTPGDWQVRGCSVIGDGEFVARFDWMRRGDLDIGAEEARSNAAFTATVKNALPKLLDALEARSNPIPDSGELVGRSCSCADIAGEDPRCILHGNGTMWAKENPDICELVDRLAAQERQPVSDASAMRVLLPPAANVPDEYLEGWIEGQQYLIDNRPRALPLDAGDEL